MRLKKGDTATITGNTNNHGFKIGTEVVIWGVYSNNNYYIASNNNFKWSVREEDLNNGTYKLITEVEKAFNKMPKVFFMNYFVKQVYNPNNSHGGTIARGLRKLKKRGTINYSSSNSGIYKKIV